MESKTKVKRGEEQARRFRVCSLLVRDARACPALLGAADRGPVAQTASFLEEITEKQGEMLAAEYDVQGKSEDLRKHFFSPISSLQARPSEEYSLQSEVVSPGHSVAHFHSCTTWGEARRCYILGQPALASKALVPKTPHDEDSCKISNWEGGDQGLKIMVSDIASSRLA